MPTDFNTSFGAGDEISHEHVKQFAKPINDLESGAAFYRVATNTDETYEVDFSSASLLPGQLGHTITSLQPGQIINFKASADSMDDAALQVTVEGGTATYPLYSHGLPVESGAIKKGQIVQVVFNSADLGRFDAIGFSSSRVAELDRLNPSQGNMIKVLSDGSLSLIPPGQAGDRLTMVLGAPKWEPGPSPPPGSNWFTRGLVAYGYRYENITNIADVLKTSSFYPETGKTYLIRWTANHSDSVAQLNLASAISNGESHFCQAVEVVSSTVHDIGLSSPSSFDYTFTALHRTKTREFVWTATTDNLVEIQLGQTSLDYGEFTGTLMVYEVVEEAVNLGWGNFGTGYSWLEDPSNTSQSIGAGTYRTGVVLDSAKTYAFLGNWTHGTSMKLVLRQGTDYWRLPPDSDTWVVVSGSEHAYGAPSYGSAMYFDGSSSPSRGDFIRFFSPPSTGTFEFGCAFYQVQCGCFWLIEFPTP